MSSEKVRFKYRILSAGSLVLDILPRFLPDADSSLVNTILAEGRVTESPGFCIYTGGSVGNTGVALARLGVPVRLKSKIGDDVVGGFVSKLINLTGADIDLDVIKGEKSTASIAIAISGRDKSTIHQRGASQTIKADDFSDATFKDIDLFILGYPTTMKYLYANNGEELVQVMKKAKENGVITAIDTSLPDLNSDSGKVDWRPILEKLYPYLDIFMPSLEEALFMTDLDRYKSLIKKYGCEDLLHFMTEDDIEQIANKAISGGVKVMLIKCGVRGMYLRTANPEFLSKEWHNREIWSTPFVADSVISTTGAGDTAIAGFLCGISASLSPEESLSFGSYTSSICVSSYDTSGKFSLAPKMLSDMKKAVRSKCMLNSESWVESRDMNGIFYGKKDIRSDADNSRLIS